MRFIGRLIKSLLRSLSSIITFLLLIGLAKMDRNLNGYIQFLDNEDWSVFSRSQPATWNEPFRPNKQISGDIADMLSGDSVDADLSWLDVYDPTFEQDFNDSTGSFASGTEVDYWFTISWQSSSDTSTSTPPNWSLSWSKSQLLNLIKQRELNK